MPPGWIVVLWRVRFGNLDLCRALVDRGCKVNELDIYKQNCLHLACTHDYSDVVRFLVENTSIQVNCENTFKETPLHKTARAGNLQLTKYFLQHGAIITKGLQGWPKELVPPGNPELVRLLEEAQKRIDRQPQEKEEKQEDIDSKYSALQWQDQDTRILESLTRGTFSSKNVSFDSLESELNRILDLKQDVKIEDAALKKFRQNLTQIMSLIQTEEPPKSPPPVSKQVQITEVFFGFVIPADRNRRAWGAIGHCNILICTEFSRRTFMNLWFKPNPTMSEWLHLPQTQQKHTSKDFSNLTGRTSSVWNWAPVSPPFRRPTLYLRNTKHRLRYNHIWVIIPDDDEKQPAIFIVKKSPNFYDGNYEALLITKWVSWESIWPREGLWSSDCEATRPWSKNGQLWRKSVGFSDETICSQLAVVKK